MHTYIIEQRVVAARRAARAYVWNSPTSAAARVILDAVLADLGIAPARIRFLRALGCGCGCSPGFLLEGIVGVEIHVREKRNTRS